jgi:hypothetical protein
MNGWNINYGLKKNIKNSFVKRSKISAMITRSKPN